MVKMKTYEPLDEVWVIDCFTTTAGLYQRKYYTTQAGFDKAYIDTVNTINTTNKYLEDRGRPQIYFVTAYKCKRCEE